MTRSLVRFSLTLLLLLGAGSFARADVTGDLASHLGKTIDLRTEQALRRELLEAGLISHTDFKVTVTPQLLETAVGMARFRAHVDGTRYHVGDRLLVENNGLNTDGRFTGRAEIKEILPDGRYKVTVWSKPETANPSVPWGHVDALTDGAGSSNVKVKITNADGTVTETTSRAPWAVRSKPREIVLTHEEIDKLNGRVEPKGVYNVNGWTIDKENDPVLRERLAKARATVESIMPADKLVLPEEPAARKAKLEEIARLQEKVLDRIFADNFIEHPGNNAAANKRMSDLLRARPELSGKIGAVLESECGVCTDQAAAMVAILNEVGPRMGLTARAIGGATIREKAGHGFVALRFANGRMGMYDVTWHFRGEKNAVDNMDLATWEGVNNSNRNIDYVSQPTTDKTGFVAPTSDKARELYRGYDRATGEKILAARAKARAEKDGVSLEEGARRVLAENQGSEKIAGDFTPASVATRAADLGRPTNGLIDRLSPSDRLRDRVTDRDRVHLR